MRLQNLKDNTAMNPLLDRLQPYPFERLKQLFAPITPNNDYSPISLGIGEPKHATPQFILDSISSNFKALSGYPPTIGELALRQSCSNWLNRRYGVQVDPKTQILPVNGSREALFSFTQAVIDPSLEQGNANSNGSRKVAPFVICPNPFYQIYEGAALLAGAEPYYVPSDPMRNFGIDWSQVSSETWQRTQMVIVCSPGNPTGAVMGIEEWRKLFELSEKYGFVIASDECYSEIYFKDEPPLGGLEAAQRLGIENYKNIVAFTSLSKRSNVPGMRSGFVAGDEKLIKSFLLYRTYHGSCLLYTSPSPRD